MSATCPNPNDPGWKQLVSSLGEANALVAFTLHNHYKKTADGMPTVSEAQTILDNRSVLEKDEQLIKRSTQFKLERAVEQNFLIQQATISGSGARKVNEAQRETLNRLSLMNARYQAFLNSQMVKEVNKELPDKVMSVTKMIGSGDFKGDPTEYEDFARFGTFIHEVIELAQVQAMQQDTRPNKILTRDFFDNALKEYNAKKPFNIDKLTSDEMFEKVFEVVQHISSKYDYGFIVIPELTVFGETHIGDRVVGRLDLVLIDVTGKIHIFDFKTKKVSGMMLEDAFGLPTEKNLDGAFEHLATKKYNAVTHQDYSTEYDSDRTAYDNWFMQLQIYNNILAQNQIETGTQEIVAWLYEIDPVTKAHLGAEINIFSGENFYDYAANIFKAYDFQQQKLAGETTHGGEKLKHYRKILNKYIPYPGVETEEETERAIVQENLPITDESYENFKKKILANINAQLVEVRRLLQPYRGMDPMSEDDQTMRDLYQNRFDTLLKTKNIIEKPGDQTDVFKSINFNLILTSLKEDIIKNVRVAEAVRDRIDAGNPTSAQNLAIHTAYQKSKDFQATLTVMEEIIDQFVKDKDSGINNDSPIVKEMELLRMEIRNTETVFRQVSQLNGLKILKVSGEVNFKRVNEGLTETISLEIQNLETARQKLLDKKPQGLVQEFRSKMLSLISKEYREQLEEKLKDDAPWLRDLKQIELQIAKKKVILDGGLSFSDEALTKYMNAITDPESMIYIGAQNVFSENNIMQGMMLDAGIASVSNSDLLISSMTQLLKNAEAEARRNLINGVIEMDFDKLRDNILKRFTVEELNDKITEIRTIHVFNSETNQTEEKQFLYFAKPYSEAYEQKYKEFEAKTRQFAFETDTLKREVGQALKDFGVGTVEHVASMDAYLAKVKEKQEYEKSYLDWQLENCSMEYKDEFYKLQQLMPAEIREEMNKLIHEKENLAYRIEKESEVYQDDTELDEIMDIERRMKALRERAKAESPEYEAYLEKSSEYYTYETNFDYFLRAEASAKVKFSGKENEHLLQRWYKFNTVVKPTDEWYALREQLYQARADILEQDSEISDRIMKRSKILKPYRINGKLQLQLLTDEDSEKLNEIEAEIDEITLLKTAAGRQELSGEQRGELAEISKELMRIQSKRLTESYKDTMNNRVKELRSTILLKRNAEAELAKARTAGDDVLISEAKGKLLFFEEQHHHLEKEFEKWYNKLHYDEYQPLEKGFDPKAGRPKGWAYENFPSDSVKAEFTQQVPAQKYTLRKVKKEVIGNPDFQRSPDGIPMPKGIVRNADKSFSVLSDARKENVNDKYLEMAGDAEVMNFYNALMKLSFDLQSKTTGEKMGYRVPGYASSSIENIAREGIVGSFDKNFKVFHDRVLKLHGSAQDKVSGEFGDVQLDGEVRNRFVRQLPLNIQTRDGVGAVMKWAEEAHMNIAMSQVAPQTDMFIDYMKLMAEDIEKQFQKGKAVAKNPDGSDRHVDMRKRLAELNNVIEIMEFERRKFIKGQAEISNSNFDRAMKKTLNAVFTWTSFARIGFDLANQTKNMISGNIQSFLASGLNDSSHYSRRDLAWAKSKMYSGPDSFFANYFSDWGRLSDVGYDTLLYRTMNPLQKDFGKYLTEVTGTKGRRFTGKMLNPLELSFALQDKGDTEIGLTVMYAIMNRYKFKKIKSIDPTTGEKEYELDKNGEPVLVPSHQAYVKTREGFIRDPSVEYSQDDENRVRNIIYSEVRRAQGNYAKSDQTKFEEGVLGRFVFFYRKYLIPTFINRFGYLRPNWESGDAALGYWRAVAIVYRNFGVKEGSKHLLLGGWTDLNSNKRFGPNKVGNFMTAQVSHASRDMGVMLMLVVASNIILSMVNSYEDDDPEEVSFMEFLMFNIFRIIWGVKGEATSMFPLGGGSQEYIRNFTTLTTYTRELTALKNTAAHLFSSMLNLFVNGMDAPPEEASEFAKEIYKDSHYMRKQGAYDKGDPKLMKDLYDMSGMKNIRDLFDPENRIDQMKKTQ